jgi:hypothetical protein
MEDQYKTMFNATRKICACNGGINIFSAEEKKAKF